MRTIDEHLALILANTQALGTETVDLTIALGRTLRESVTSTVDLPPWPNSAMDGYAVMAGDLLSARVDHPITLPVVGDIPAGSTTPTQLEPGTALRIMTGAPIPAGCEAVVPLEKTLEWNESTPTPDAPLPAQISFIETPVTGANIRNQGEDITVGATVLLEGTVLTPNRIASVAASGVSRVCVNSPLRVAVISTGTELVPVGGSLEFGQIYDSNSILLSSLVRDSGAEVSLARSVADDPVELRSCIHDAQQTSDVILVTGGASVGAHDTTRFVLDQALVSADTDDYSDLRSIEFTKVAMQPGKPQGFGQLADGTHVWALPGNPVSVWVSFYMFVEPALKKLVGNTSSEPVWQAAHASTSWRSPAGREQIMPIIFSSQSGQPLRVSPATAKGSGSHLAATLAHATGIARIPAEVTQVRENDVVLVRGLGQ